MLSGITEKELETIKNITSKYPYEFYIFGSRSKGNFQANSDLDILIFSHTKLSTVELSKIREEFYDSNLPYIVNLIEKSTCSDSFYQQILPNLQKI